MCCGADCSLYKGHWGWEEQRCWNTTCVLFNILEERASFSNLHKNVVLAWLPPKQVLGKNLDAGSLLGSNFRKHTGKWGEKGKGRRPRKGEVIRGYPYEKPRFNPTMQPLRGCGSGLRIVLMGAKDLGYFFNNTHPLRSKGCSWGINTLNLGQAQSKAREPRVERSTGGHLYA